MILEDASGSGFLKILPGLVQAMFKLWEKYSSFPEKQRNVLHLKGINEQDSSKRLSEMYPALC